MDMMEPEFDPEHLVDTFLFGLVGGCFWTVASVYNEPWLLALGAPFIVMFVVSVWRLFR
jgi:hypothetical protein